VTPDITPIVRFDQRLSYEELTTPIDDEQNAQTWREIALAALALFRNSRVENERIRADRRPA
jgi:hypothetical protein